MAKKVVSLERFCFRQFDDASYQGTHLLGVNKDEFTNTVNLAIERGAQLLEGYAPFCKHVFIRNFTSATVGAVEITPANVHLVKSGYVSRTEKELPVLSRWIDRKDIQQVPTATWLDIILYSREQILKEDAAMGEMQSPNDAPWGIISVKAQDVDRELPMQPITVMRNALGIEHGGSGDPLSKEAYMNAVEYWETHAILK